MSLFLSFPLKVKHIFGVFFFFGTSRWSALKCCFGPVRLKLKFTILAIVIYSCGQNVTKTSYTYFTLTRQLIALLMTYQYRDLSDFLHFQRYPKVRLSILHPVFFNVEKIKSARLFYFRCMFTDNDGPYYWHIKSGTIQRDPPDGEGSLKNEPRTPLVKDVESVSL